jgi:hypothetical protein
MAVFIVDVSPLSAPLFDPGVPNAPNVAADAAFRAS